MCACIGTVILPDLMTVNSIYEKYKKVKKVTHHLSHGLGQVVDDQVRLPVVLQVGAEADRGHTAPAQNLQARLHHLKTER